MNILIATVIICCFVFCYFILKLGKTTDIVAEESFLLLKKMEKEGIITINKDKLETFYSYDPKNRKN